MGTLLQRPVLKIDFEPKYAVILNILEEEMETTKKIFDEQNELRMLNEKLNLHRNMPDVSGGLKWAQELRDRVCKHMKKYKRLIDHPSSKSEQMERIDKKYNEMLELLEQFCNEIYKHWCQHVGKLSDDNLEKNLIQRDQQTNTIKTNFDPQLIAVLKEVKYLGMLKKYEIPAEATAIHENNDQYRKFITSLDYMVDSYNKILIEASKEEKPLIASELKKIDAELENGEKHLKWKSPEIDEYIVKMRKNVSDLETRLQKSKSNLEKIQTLMSARADTPLFRRFEQKSTLLQLDDKQQRLDNRSKEIRETGQKIHDLVNTI